MQCWVATIYLQSVSVYEDIGVDRGWQNPEELLQKSGLQF